MSLIFDKILQYHYYPRHKKTEPSTYCELSQRYQKKFRGELKMFRGTISPQQAACPRPPRVRPTLSSACRAPRPLRPLLLPRHDAGDPASRGHRLPAPDALLPPLPLPTCPQPPWRRTGTSLVLFGPTDSLTALSHSSPSWDFVIFARSDAAPHPSLDVRLQEAGPGRHARNQAHARDGGSQGTRPLAFAAPTAT